MSEGRIPKGIAEILASLKQTAALAKSFEEARIWERWPEVAGSGLMPHGRPLGVRDGTLFIEVDGAAWMHKFSYRKWDILKHANRIAGREIASDVFFKLASDDPEPGPREGDPGGA